MLCKSKRNVIILHAALNALGALLLLLHWRLLPRRLTLRGSLLLRGLPLLLTIALVRQQREVSHVEGVFRALLATLFIFPRLHIKLAGQGDLMPFLDVLRELLAAIPPKLAVDEAGALAVAVAHIPGDAEGGNSFASGREFGFRVAGEAADDAEGVHGCLVLGECNFDARINYVPADSDRLV